MQAAKQRLAMRTENLHVTFGTREALKGVGLAIPEKSISCVIGPSGCGKTVLLQSFNRLNELERNCRIKGEVFLGDENVAHLDPVVLRRRVGMVFKRPTPFNLSIYDNVAYSPRLFGTSSRAQLDELVESSLRLVGLWKDVQNSLRKKPDTLSTGQQQRLCIARSLVADPEVLILDDPTTDLGPGATMLIEELLLQLAGSRTIVYSTHDMQQAVRLSDYCAFLLGGTLVETASTEKIFNAPSDERTYEYISGQLL